MPDCSRTTRCPRYATTELNPSGSEMERSLGGRQ
jgi:hypothetical protein